MAEKELTEREKEEKLEAIRSALVDSRARAIREEVRMHSVALCCHDLGVSPLDMAFHIDRRRLVIAALMDVALELEAAVKSGE